MRARGVDIRLAAPIDAVRRTPGGVEVKAAGGDWEAFDEVVFATHSDDSLAFWPTRRQLKRSARRGALPAERGGAARRCVGHAEAQGDCWSSWNYTEAERVG
jgi:predicted NAD/FAD-binding protein